MGVQKPSGGAQNQPRAPRGAHCLPRARWLRVPAVQQAGKLRPCGCWNEAKPHSETTKYPAGNWVGGPETTEPVLNLPLHATSCSSWEILSRGGSVVQHTAPARFGSGGKSRFFARFFAQFSLICPTGCSRPEPLRSPEEEEHDGADPGKCRTARKTKTGTAR